MFDFNKIKKTFIIAEISANHGRSFDRAVSLIRKAKDAGADAVKFQAYTPDTMTIKSDKRPFMIRGGRWGGQTLYDLYEKAHMPLGWFKRLKKISDGLGILFFATAFDRSAVDLLEEIGVPFHKIASFELVDLPLIEYAAKTGRSMLLSTGMADISEIISALNTAKSAGAGSVALLKCVSSYPADPSEMNLRTIPHMRKFFKCPVGLSDHTLGTAVSLAAVSLGAAIIEKHVTLSRKAKTPDSFFSLEPQELKRLVEDVRIAEEALGKVHYGLTSGEKKSRVFRRSLFVVKDMKRGEPFTHENVRSIRPAGGLEPAYLKKILGCRASRDISKGTPVDRRLIGSAYGGPR